VPIRILKGLASTAVSVLIFLLGLEVGLRALSIGNDSLARPHPWTGWTLIPKRRVDVRSEESSSRKRVRVEVNALGLRDVERRFEKPPGVYRILVLGDSFIEGDQVPLDSTVTRHLERALDGIGGRRVEVWNCGVNGYTTSQELLYLRHVARGFRPDLVVNFFLAANDVADAVPALATSLRNRPFYREAGDSLVLDLSFFREDAPPVAWLRLHSRLFTWANFQRQVFLMRRRGYAGAEWKGEGMPPSLQIYAAHPDSVWSHAWDLTERLTIALREEARLQGADFMLVVISSGAQEHPGARRGTEAAWAKWQSRADLSLEMPERRMQRLCDAHGIECVQLLPAFRAEQTRTNQPLHFQWTAHWNAGGHALAARVVAERIAARLGPPAR
jgi:hypothetical protein